MTINWWTLGFQTVNVVILVWLLGRFFWRPVAAMIEERHAKAQAILADAEAKRTAATAAKADIDKTREGFAKERDAILAGAHETAEKARTARLAEAVKEANALEGAAKAAVEKAAIADRQAWAARSATLAMTIAKRLLARLDSAAVQATFLDWLRKAIGDLPAATRAAMTQPDVALEVSSATTLNTADQERCRQVIDEAFGAQPQIAFKTDPTLIAGLELTGPNVIVSNSWRADLNRILADVSHDK